MFGKYNSFGRLRVHGAGSSIVRRLREAAAWLTFTSKTGATIAGFMLLEVAAPVWALAPMKNLCLAGPLTPRLLFSATFLRSPQRPTRLQALNVHDASF